ncbi:hypothetical protein [Olleya sp. ITB9]|uniref:hypothetical protein n=1 Tax=Olleya sp. ITB9 TaxID=1715648 RepID=UPI0006D0E279|nr:hypothetical protein [Olleya sp. ITB9]
MENKTVNNNKLSQNLGKLFYAIATVDGTLSEIETETLKQKVSDNWVFSESNEDIIDAFIWFSKNKEYESEESYNSFIKYKQANETLFTKTLKKAIIAVAINIASSFSKTNKAELMLLAKLEIEFEKEINP